MRAALLLVLVACTGRPNQRVPHVDSPHVVMDVANHPVPDVVLVDENGATYFVTPASWQALDAYAIWSRAEPLDDLTRLHGGIGTPLALEEGTMSKRDAQRCEGKYCVRRRCYPKGFVPYATREQPRLLVLAATRAPAKAVLDVIRVTRAGVAVEWNGHTRPLAFELDAPPHRYPYGAPCPEPLVLASSTSAQELVDLLVEDRREIVVIQ